MKDQIRKYYSIRLLILLLTSLLVTANSFAQDWSKKGYFYSGDVDFALDVNDGDVVALANQAIYRKSNSSNSWQKIIDVKKAKFGTEGNGKILYLDKTSSRLFAGFTLGSGLYLSGDKGQSWSRVDSFVNKSVTSICSSESGIIFVGTIEAGLYMSKDSGSSWSKISNSKINDVKYSELYQTLFIALDRDIACTYDFGKVWYSREIAPQGLNSVTALSIDPASGMIIACNKGYGTGIYKSTDNGSSWSKIISDITSSSISFYNNKFLISCAYSGLYEYDRTTSPKKISPAFLGVTSSAVTSSQDLLVSSLGMGLLKISNSLPQEKKTDITNWSIIGVYQYGNSRGMVKDAGGNFFWATSRGLCYYDVQSGRLSVNNFFNLDVYKVIQKNNTLYASVQSSDSPSAGIYSSSDGGTSWTQIVSRCQGLFSYPWDILALNDGTLYYYNYIPTNGNTAGIYKYANGSNSLVFDKTTQVTKLVYDDKNSALYYASTGLWKSTNGGVVWLPLTNSISASLAVYDIQIDNATDRIFIATNLGVYYSNLNTIAWNKISGDYTSKLFVSGNNVLYPKSSQLYVSFNTDGNWKSATAGLNTGVVQLYPDNGKLYVLASDDLYEYHSQQITGNPLPASPLNGSHDQPTDISLQWTSPNNSELYSIKLSNDSSFSSSIIDSITTGTQVQASKLSNLTRYFWKVKALNLLDQGLSSEVFNFTTVIASPEGPVLSYPIKSATNQPLALTLKWSTAKRAETYTLQLASDAAFNNLIINDTALTDSNKLLTGLKNSTTYYWRVCAKNVGGTSAWSDLWSFTTIVSAPAVPVQVFPIDKSIKQPVSLRLNWNISQNAETYRLQLSEDSLFTIKIVDDSTLSVTAKDITGLKSGMKYFWRVQSRNIAGQSDYSTYWSFITLLPTPADLIASAFGLNKVKLTWTNKSDNVGGFILEKTLGNSNSFALVDTIKNNTTSYIDTTVALSTTYKYRIKAFSRFASSEYTNEVSVTTLTGVDDLRSIPIGYSVMQNYPNPFNPVTVIKYGLPVESSVRIVVYNSLGEAVRELTNSVKPSGYHNLSFDASGISSGIYYYSIEARAIDGSKEYREIKKMAVIK